MKSSVRHCAAAVAIVALGLTPAACSSSSGGSGKGKASGKLSIGVVELDDSQTFSATQHTALDKAIKAKGWSAKFIDSKGSPANAISAMQNLLQGGVDALIVQTYAANQLTTGLAAAKAKHVPVFVTGGGNVEAGEAGAIQFINAEPINNALLGYIKKQQSVPLIQLGFTPGAPCLARSKNLNAQLSGVSNVTSTKRELQFPGADASSQTSVTGWLEANAKTAGKSPAIWLCTSDAVSGVIAAEKQLKRGPYPLYTWDVSAPALAGVRSGYVTGVLYMPAGPSSQQLVQMISDERAAGKSWKPKTVAASSVIIDKSNVDKYAGAE